MEERKEIIDQALLRAKKGEVEGFETIYILTYQDIYKSILASGQDEKSAEQLLETLYISAYERIDEVSVEDDILEWLKELLYGLGEEQENHREDEMEITRTLPEEKAATIFLSIEEQLGFLVKEEQVEACDHEEKEKKASFGRMMVSVLMFLVVIAAVLVGVWKMKSHFAGNSSEALSKSPETMESTVTKDTPPKEEEEVTVISLFDQIFVLSEDGKLISSKKQEETCHEAVQNMDGFTYYLLQDSEVPDEMKGTLLRVYNKNPDEYEVIDDNVKDYVLQDHKIYYVKDGMIEIEDPGRTYGKRKFTYYLKMKDDGFYVVNEIGSTIGSQITSIQMEDRLYFLENGSIQFVEEAECREEGIIYYLDDFDGNGWKELWWQSDGDSGIFVQEGIGITSFCMADGWIYYSACEETDPEGMYFSRVYRIRPDASEQELVADTFQGIFRHMYYSEENNKIYAEYMPDSHRYYGQIAAVSLDGTMEILQDSDKRTGEAVSGNDMLMFVGTEGNNIYCYWCDCEWVPGDKARILWKKPVVLTD